MGFVSVRQVRLTARRELRTMLVWMQATAMSIADVQKRVRERIAPPAVRFVQPVVVQRLVRRAQTSAKALALIKPQRTSVHVQTHRLPAKVVMPMWMGTLPTAVKSI